MNSKSNSETSDISTYANTSNNARTTVGALVESFRLPDVRGGDVTLVNVLERARAVLIFYRGGWCPLCNRQLAELSLRYGEFQSRAIEILAISNEEVTQGQKVLAKISPPYPLLLDPTSEVIARFGLVVDKRDPLGLSLRKHAYAHPAVAIVGRDSRVDWFFRGRNYRDRPSPDAILEAADRAAATQSIKGAMPNRLKEDKP